MRSSSVEASPTALDWHLSQKMIEGRPILAVVLIAVCCGLPCASQSAAQVRNRQQQARSQRSAKSKPSAHTHEMALAERAVNESYELGGELPADARTLHLISLCSAASDMEFLSSRRREWIEELYRLGGELDASARARAQAPAVSFMAALDAKRALQMFDGIESPGNSQPDPRPWTARILFAKVLDQQGAKAIPALRTRARRLGEDGVYPYSAMMPVVTKLKDQPEKASEVFAEALAYYRRASSPASSNMSFISLLSGARLLKVIPDWLMHEAAQELATRVTRGVEGSTDAIASGVWSREKLQFRSAYSLLEDLDPEVAATMKAQHPSIMADFDGMGTNQQERASYRSYTDDPEYQRIGNAASKLVQDIMSMSEDGKQDSPDMQAAISQAMTLAVKQAELALDAAPEEAREIRRDSATLNDVVHTASKISPDITLREIDRINDTELRAYALIQFASGIGELRFMREAEKSEEAKPAVVRSQ